MGGEQTATPLSLTPWDTLFTETDVNYFMLRQSFAPSQKFGYEFGIWNISCSTQKCFPLFRPLGMPCFLPRLELVLFNVVHWAPVQRLVRENSQELLLQGGKETGLSRECYCILYIGPQAGTGVPSTESLPWNPRSRPLYLYTIQASGAGCHQIAVETLGKMPFYPWATGG